MKKSTTLQKKDRYDIMYKNFKWQIPEYFNFGFDVVDQWGEDRTKLALISIDRSGKHDRYHTFYDLSVASNKFANVLIREIGVRKGDRVFFFLERIPEIFIGILGTLKAGAVIGPLFSAFGPEAVKDRLVDSRAKVLVTSPMLKKKVVEILPDLPHLEKIIVVNRRNDALGPDDLS